MTASFAFSRLEIRVRLHAVHLRKARGVPELGAEIAVAGDAGRVELHIPALRRHDGQREAQRIRAIFVDQVERVDDIALGLRHFLPVLVAHQSVDIDGVERLLLHEVDAHHHHPGDPEEDDVKAGDEHVGLVIAGEFRRFLRPAEGGEGPEGGGEPCVEDVGVATIRV